MSGTWVDGFLDDNEYPNVSVNEGTKGSVMYSIEEKAQALFDLINEGETRSVLIDGELVDREVIKDICQAYINLIDKLETIDVRYSEATGTFDNVDALLKHLAELEEKKLVQCPNCDEQFFVDEDGGIDAFIGA